MTVVLPDNSEILALIPGKFRKRCWMGVGDIVLVSRRDFQDGKVDIVHKYMPNEIQKLYKDGEIPDFFIDTNITNTEDCSIIIGDENDNEPVIFDNI